MAKLDEKIIRFESYLRQLADDRENFAKGEMELAIDGRIVKAWVRQLDQVATLLTAMVDDWKEVSARGSGREKHPIDHVGNANKMGIGGANSSDETSPADDR